MAKKRIDVLITEKGLAESRAKAQAFLMSGQVIVSGKKIDKVGTLVDENADIEIKEKFPYVSRGALKIQKAYEEFGLDFDGKVICDIGSSTGGFTDFALQHSAKKIYAIDVGYGQLDQKLREDPRVVVMEKTNFRDINSWEDFSKLVILASKVCPESELSAKKDSGQARMTIEKIDFFVCDVSFISLKKIIPKIKSICHSRLFLSFPPLSVIPTEAGIQDIRRINSDGNLDPRVKPEDDKNVEVVLLIKPQFEVGKEIADKCKGVIKDEEIQNKVVEDIARFSENAGFTVKGLAESPITGAKGNKEFLIWLDI